MRKTASDLFLDYLPLVQEPLSDPPRAASAPAVLPPTHMVSCPEGALLDQRMADGAKKSLDPVCPSVLSQREALKLELLQDLQRCRENVSSDTVDTLQPVRECYSVRKTEWLNICLNCCPSPHSVELEGGVPVGHKCDAPPTILVCPNTMKAVELKCPKCAGREPFKVMQVSTGPTGVLLDVCDLIKLINNC